MGDSIRLHHEHGVNPTIPLCFWCEKPRNEVALLGAAYKGRAPRHMCIDYEPCDTCKANMARGITLVEAKKTPASTNQPEIQTGVYPTGRWAVITEDAARKIFGPASAESTIRMRKAFIDVALAEEIGLFAVAVQAATGEATPRTAWT